MGAAQMAASLPPRARCRRKSDCTAALSDEEQRATLENVIQQFGDVLTADEALALMP